MNFSHMIGKTHLSVFCYYDVWHNGRFWVFIEKRRLFISQFWRFKVQLTWVGSASIWRRPWSMALRLDHVKGRGVRRRQ